MLVEYVYCDERRLDSYLQQFRSPVHYDSRLAFKVGISLTGPTGEGGLTSQGRALTRHEKVEAFTNYAVERELISGVRPSLSNEREKPFIDETFTARRCAIAFQSHELALWVSMPQSGSGGSGRRDIDHALFLIEDQRVHDDDGPSRYSGYSSLYLLVGELHRDHREYATAFERLARGDDATAKFARDPFGFLVDVGAVIGPQQTVRAVYLFRAECIDMQLGGTPGAVVTVGYPLFMERVAASGDTYDSAVPTVT
ncbi:hypothetical protein I6F15_11610 [Bradyrhizobium sp. BRP14]|nr:hypothetical protein [Bradyrhizobium sp. BRP14]